MFKIGDKVEVTEKYPGNKYIGETGEIIDSCNSNDFDWVLKMDNKECSQHDHFIVHENEIKSL